MTIIRKIARPLLAGSFVYNGVTRLRHPEESSRYLTPAVDAAAKADSRLNTLKGQEKLINQAIAGAQIGAGALFAIGRFPRLSSAVLVATGSLNAYLDFRASNAATEVKKEELINSSLKNVSLVGAVAIAAVDTSGNPSLAWRASKLSEDLQKKSEHLSKDFKKKSEDLLNH